MTQEQKELARLVEEGYTVVLLGTPNHPEVVGLLGFAPDAILVDEEEDWDAIPRRKRMALLTQSTQPPWKFEKLAGYLTTRAHELKIVNTVCPVTIRRQQDTTDLAEAVDLVVVVGGRNSANTKELTRLVGIVGKPAVQIERADDLEDAAVFEGYAIVGVTGGTSTPIEDLEAVAARIYELAGSADEPGRCGRAGARGRHRRGRVGLPQLLAQRRLSVPTRRTRRRPRSVDRDTPVAGLPVVAIVGRPNVGKSTLFNRIVGQRQAIVEDRARTTRDRLYGVAEWNGRRYVVIDTGGMEIDPGDAIEERVQDQARLAIEEADVIVFVVDAAAGETPADQEVAETLRRAQAPVIMAINKADNEKLELQGAEFLRLGWEDWYAVSALHGRGTGDLLDAIVEALPEESFDELERKRREAEADDLAEQHRRGHRARDRRARARAMRPTGSGAGSTKTRPRRASPSWAGPTWASRRCSTSCWARSAPSSATSPAPPATPSTPRSSGRVASCASWIPPACGVAARSPRARPRSATRRCAPSRPSAGPTSACSCSTPRTGWPRRTRTSPATSSTRAWAWSWPSTSGTSSRRTTRPSRSTSRASARRRRSCTSRRSWPSAP